MCQRAVTSARVFTLVVLARTIRTAEPALAAQLVGEPRTSRVLAVLLSQVRASIIRRDAATRPLLTDRDGGQARCAHRKRSTDKQRRCNMTLRRTPPFEGEDNRRPPGARNTATPAQVLYHTRRAYGRPPHNPRGQAAGRFGMQDTGAVRSRRRCGQRLCRAGSEPNAQGKQDVPDPIDIGLAPAGESGYHNKACAGVSH